MRKAPEFTQIALVWRIIEQHRGRANAISARAIAAAAGIADREGSYIREIIRYLIIDRGRPIGSNLQGFYYMEDQKDYDETMIILESRIRETIERRDALRRAWAGRIQQGMFDSSGVKNADN